MQEEILHILELISRLNSFSPYLIAPIYVLGHIWWFFLPFLFYPNFKDKYMEYMNTQYVLARPNMLLEIKLPREIKKPIRAMENVFNALFAIYDPPGDWKEHYFEGKVVLRFSVEITGIDGIPHFYIRIPRGAKNVVESAFYAQYSEIEIVEVPDYVDMIPQDIPNNEWDCWGCEFKGLAPSDVYPFRTYESFFEENPDAKDERKFDPLSTLIENINLLSKGEQLWIQIVARPVASVDTEDNYVKRGKEEIDRLLQRGSPEKKKSPYDGYPMIILIWIYIAKIIFPNLFPAESEEAKEDSAIPMEFRLTQGEREVVSAIENKISKTCFKTTMRFMYVARREKFFGAAKGYAISHFGQFATQNLNRFKPHNTTKVQPPAFMRKGRVYLKKRNMFFRYLYRELSYDDRMFMNEFSDATYLASSEELATLFHFPSSEVVPNTSISRVETKKGAPPASLPIEE